MNGNTLVQLNTPVWIPEHLPFKMLDSMLNTLVTFVPSFAYRLAKFKTDRINADIYLITRLSR